MTLYNGHGGNILQICAAYGLQPSEVIDFSANINPLGYPKGLPDALREELPIVRHYPDIDSSLLRKAIAQKTLHREEEVLIGSGSTEFIYLIPRALRPKKGLVFQPTYSDYAKALRLSGAVMDEIICREEEAFRCDLGHPLLRNGEFQLIFLCNPNNPTGVLLEREDILRLAEGVKEGFIVVDEAFMDFVDITERHSILQEAGRRKNIILLRSLTKFFAFPGLRLGYMVAHPEVIERMEEFKEPWTVNTLAQRAGLVALGDEEHSRRTRDFLRSERMFLYNEFSKIRAIRPIPPSANFILSKILYSPTAQELQKHLIKKGIIIRDCSNFPGLEPQYFRVAVRTREENLRLVSSIKSALEELSVK